MTKSESKYFNTAKKMGDALLSLLDKKDYLYITVKDICNEAGVNRSTFYLHYEGVDDLLQEVIENTSKSFAEHFNHEQRQAVLQDNNLDDLYLIKDEFLIPYLEFIKDNKKVYKAINNNRSLFKVNSTYKRLFKELFSPILSRFGLDEKWHKYVMDFYITGLNATVMDWVGDDCQEDIHDVSNLIKGLIIKYEGK